MPPHFRYHCLRHHSFPPTITIPALYFRSYSTSISASMPVHPPSPRPQNWKAAAPAPPAGTTTFSAQSSLPKLPVLPLIPTLDRLKRTLGPIAHTNAELAEAERKIDAFANGIGPELQRRLEVHAQGRPHWLEEWWDDGAYLSYRDSVCGHFFSHNEIFTNKYYKVMVNVSYYCPLLSLLFACPVSNASRRWLCRATACAQ